MYEPHTPPKVENRLSQVAETARKSGTTTAPATRDGFIWWMAGGGLLLAVLVTFLAASLRHRRTVATLIVALGLAGTASGQDLQPDTDSAKDWSNGGQRVCGVYSVFLGGKILGVPCRLETVMKGEFVSSSQGSSLREVVAAGEALGMKAQPFYGLTTDGLANLSLPAVLHIRGRDHSRKLDHYVLLTAVDGEALTILNGTAGIQHRHMADLAARWEGTGIALGTQATGLHVPSGLGRGARAIIIVGLGLGLICIAQYATRWRLSASMMAGALLMLAAASATGWQAYAADAPLHALNETAWVEKWFTNAFIPDVALTDVTNADSRSTAIVDARTLQDFDAGHIRDALRIDPRQAMAGTAPIPVPVRDAQTVIVYCNNADCGASHIVAQHLRASGVQDVRVYSGGWDEYQRAGTR